MEKVCAILLIFLGAVSPAHAGQCFAAALGVGGQPEAAVLDMSARWVVENWTATTNISNGYKGVKAGCIADELLARKSELLGRSNPETACGDEGTIGPNMKRIIDADPIMQKCSNFPDRR